MMKIISNTICLSVFSLVCPAILFASLPSAYASLVDTSQNQTFESRPTHSFKLAAVHFITNDNALNFGNQEFLPGDLCKQGGYTHEGCPSGYVKGEPCPYDSKFVKDCIDPDTWCKNNGYAITSCSVPKYPANPCPYKSSLYKSCETDNIRACKELGYSLTCETGKVGGDSCPYNSSYKKCICNPCSGYDYTAAQASAQGYVPGEVCNSCGTVKYKRSENKCDGYKACDCGGESGAKVCYSGLVQKFDTCKVCCDSKYQYDSSNCTGGKVLAGSSCGGKYEKCQAMARILYSDRTTSYELDTTKTPIGVVLDENKKLALALEGYTAAWQMAGKYNRYYFDVPGIQDISAATDGKVNTQKMIDFGKNNQIEGEYVKHPAAEFCYNYKPKSCAIGAWCAAGEWFMGSYRDMQFCRDEGIVEKINNTFSLLKSANRGCGTWVSNALKICTKEDIAAGICGNRYLFAYTVGGNVINADSYYKVIPVIRY